MLPERDNCGFGLLVDTKSPPTHRLVTQALTGLARLTHRGAIGEDGLAGDGCGIMLQIDHNFFRQKASEAGLELPERFAVGMCFLDPRYVAKQQRCLHKRIQQQGFSVAGWRDVSLNLKALSSYLTNDRPVFAQIFIPLPADYDASLIEKKLFIAQKKTEWDLRNDPLFTICSLSALRITYKALVLPANLPVFFPDLQNPHLRSKVALFHQRFSTNTLSHWSLCQPFSTLAHNGEINTIQGNRHFVYQISQSLIQNHLGELDSLPSLLKQTGSDSQSLDQFIQSLHHCGLNTAEGLRLLIPPSWEHAAEMPDKERDYFRYHFPFLPSWEGPAGIVFFDGHQAGCILDRNGFRPTRYQRSANGLVVAGSEVGLVDFQEEELVCQTRLRPGEILLIDTEQNLIITEGATPTVFYEKHNYSAHVRHSHCTLDKIKPNPEKTTLPPITSAMRKYFDVSYEELEQSLRFMAENAVEPTASMGDDTPLAALSKQPRQLFDFMRQQFAQVTNPPLDSLREKLVMSTMISLGNRENIISHHHAKNLQIILPSPLLSNKQFAQIIELKHQDFASHILPLTYAAEKSMPEALDQLVAQAIQTIDNNKHKLIILSDQQAEFQWASLHPAIATGALHHALIERQCRGRISIIVASGWVRDAHHAAMLIASGANAVYPWLAYALIQNFTKKSYTAFQNYRQALDKGLLKICSKMGVCTVNSYHGSQLFQVLGLNKEIIRRCFSQCDSAIERFDWKGLHQHQLQFLQKARESVSIPVRHGGLYKFAVDSEYHDYNPDVVMTLIAAVKTGDAKLYQNFAERINYRSPVMLRDFFTLKSDRAPIPINKVEPVNTLTPRFETAAMSLGALSPEAHESLAEAMNILGGRSNSGEGGEAQYRHKTIKRSKIKQIASARFGVTAEYLTEAEVIQIKIAQGAKPGEGGQLPGGKVNAMIAHLRYCSPGITLISPPPHHDIYSIEDLAQLIYDLKQINPKAYISVKLVAAPGVGTIAAGVVKSYADCVTISGYDGGTGASPLSSIRYTGCPWELGLLETQEILLRNHLRHRVTLQIDGGLKTGLDVVKAALLGAETFGFGTAPMVALGCKYLRICHLNNCATGVATQHEELRREHYQGTTQRVVTYFQWVAEEIREILAQMGYERLEEIIGRHDLLTALPDAPLSLPILHSSQMQAEKRKKLYQQPRNPPADKGLLANELIRQVQNTLKDNKSVRLIRNIQNHCRSIGANIAGFVAQQYKSDEIPSCLVTLKFRGIAGQSFAAWNVKGMHMILEGSANDYVGKGMSGGSISIRRPQTSSVDSHLYCLAGNTCLYGATGGECYIDGQTGERFAVRNSGANAVVIATGYHGCEYMTAGNVVILSTPSPNFAAGMSGGIIFVLDDQGVLQQRINPDMVSLIPINNTSDPQYRNLLKQMLITFLHRTRSPAGLKALQELESATNRFMIVLPNTIEVPLISTEEAPS